MAGQVRKEKLLANGRHWRRERGGKNGAVDSVQRQKCGQEPSVGPATPTFQRGRMESICRFCPQEIRAVGRRYLMEKIICWRFQSPMGQRGRVARPARQSQEDGK